MVDMGFSSGGEANQGWKLYMTSLVMILSAGLIVVARIATRLCAAKLESDDYTIIASLVSQKPNSKSERSIICMRIIFTVCRPSPFLYPWLFNSL